MRKRPGWLAEVTDPSGNATSYAYDAADQLTGVTDGTGQIQYSYENDELRQIQINDPESGTVYRFEMTGLEMQKQLCRGQLSDITDLRGKKRKPAGGNVWKRLCLPVYIR